MVLVAGVDDAGRGPVVGPLVVAGVLVHDHQIPTLQALGVRDSKTLSPSRRQSLAVKIKELAVGYAVAERSPREIDEVVFGGGKLNWLEAKMMVEVIQRLRPDVAYVDASDVLERRFGEQIRGMLSFDVEVVSEHHADVKYPVVSAASIIAKTHRDEAIAILRERYGDFGSGYSSDPRTQRFLLKWFREHEKEDLPDFIRKSWKTIEKLEKKARQTQLF